MRRVARSLLPINLGELHYAALRPYEPDNSTDTAFAESVQYCSLEKYFIGCSQNSFRQIVFPNRRRTLSVKTAVGIPAMPGGRRYSLPSGRPILRLCCAWPTRGRNDPASHGENYGEVAAALFT